MKHLKSIMILSGFAAPYGGNFLSTVLGLGKRLSESGWSVVYVFSKDAESRYWYNELKRMGYSTDLLDFTHRKKDFFRDLSSIISKYKIDFVYANFIGDTLLSLYSFINRDVKIISHFRSDFSNGAKRSLKGRVKDFLLYNVLARKMTILSCAKSISEMYPRKICYIEGTLAPDRIVDPNEIFTDWRLEHSILPNDIVIEIFGWSPFTKGVDVAANAVKILYERGYKNIKLAVICGLSKNITNMPCWLKENSNCSGDEPFLVYLPPTSDVFHYHRSADCFISASRSEGFSNAFLEMMSLGKKCIISDIKGTEWGSGYENVSVFKSADPESCADAILNSISNGTDVNDKVAGEIQNSYSLDKWVDKFLELTSLSIQ